VEPEILQLEIVTPLGAVVDSKADEVLIPGTKGEFGVLPGHIPFLATIRPGVVTYRVGDKTEQMAVGKGYAEVGLGNHVVVLADRSQRATEVDVDQRREELSQTELQLRNWASPIILEDGSVDPEYQAIREAYEWAQAQLDVTRKL